MKSNTDKLAEGTAWSLGGLVLFIVALFSVGHIVVVFLLMALPFLVGYLAVNAIFGKRPVYIEALAAEKKESASAAKKVEARVIRAEGVCPVGYSSQIGDTWVLNGKVEGNTPLCPKVEKLLRGSADEILRRRTATTSLVNCRGSGHMMEFELKPAEEPALVEASR